MLIMGNVLDKGACVITSTCSLGSLVPAIKIADLTTCGLASIALIVDAHARGSIAAAVMPRTLLDNLLPTAQLSIHSLQYGSAMKCAAVYLQARFNLFIWVQALDFAVIAVASRVFCASHAEAVTSLKQYASLVAASHGIIYVLTGSLVWYLDKQARQQFVQHHLSQAA